MDDCFDFDEDDERELLGIIMLLLLVRVTLAVCSPGADIAFGVTTT